MIVKIENNNGKLVVSSRTIAEELGKKHNNVIRDIENILNSENSNLSSLIISSNYKVQGQNREYKEYLLTKDGFTLYMFNIQGYQDFKLAYIQKFNEMEKSLQSYNYKIPNTFAQALKLAYEQQLKIEQLEIDNKEKETKIIEMSPKASYYDLILQSKDVVAVTVIAKDYGMTAQAFNKLLKENNIQFKCNGTWVLYSKYNGNGYTATKTTNFVHDSGEQGSRVGTYWTQKGRVFLYNFLKEKGVLPMIEKELGEVI